VDGQLQDAVDKLEWIADRLFLMGDNGNDIVDYWQVYGEIAEHIFQQEAENFYQLRKEFIETLERFYGIAEA
jgi:hypothetical protein